MADLIRRTTTLGVRVDAIPALQTVADKIHDALQTGSALSMTFVNPATVVGIQRSPEFARVFERFDVVAPDGIAMAMAIRWVHEVTASRISFDMTSLAPIVLELARDGGVTVALCGGQPGIAEQARQQLLVAYPGLRIIGTFDGYHQDETIDAILRLKPQMVICGMGAVQETFLLTLVERGWRGLGFTCGGFLDQLYHKLHYYPPVIDRLNLRWAYRLAMEPRRLWRRYLLDYPIFAIRLCKALIME